eukprot:TRINITY_DN20842_c0_g1_i1.p1 TRINITY_DN20842_c0_g1~~TRINITY_DN20842_c0_g1_i1.p1  ORF type:complete len:295 (+),score=102.31 TRINITY_DN20842_c0_g1_i1:73-957(+)
MQSVEELQNNLRTYKEQLCQVTEILQTEPGNAEYVEMANGLQELIELTEDLLTNAQPPEAGASASVPASAQEEWQPEELSIANQVLATTPPGRLSVGSKVQAVWSEDGEWYTATVEDITPIGYVVIYDGFGNQEEVDVDNVRPLPALEGVDAIAEAEKDAEETRLAIKRKIAEAAEAEFVQKELPPKLRVQPEDDEETKAAKRKKIHSFKSKVRLQQMELTQNKRQNAWQQFQSGKGKQKKVGFFTGRKKESMFKSPEDPKGKVGVIGSGKGLTEFAKRDKHLHMRLGMEEEGE